MQAAASSPEAQEKAALEMRSLQAQTAKLEAEVGDKQADTQLKTARAQKDMVTAEQLANGDTTGAELQKQQAELEMEQQRLDMELQAKREELAMKREELQMKLQLQQQAHAQDMQIKQESAAHDAQLKQAQAEQAQRQQAQDHQAGRASALRDSPAET